MAVTVVRAVEMCRCLLDLASQPVALSLSAAASVLLAALAQYQLPRQTVFQAETWASSRDLPQVTLAVFL